jgi:cob(I)alamin adenosyltransferase
MSRIYTRTGDRGETGLFGGGRVPKSDPRVAAYGTVDELSAAIGWVVSREDDHAGDLGPRLEIIQGDLFAIGAHLATPPGARSREHLPLLPAGRVEEFEGWIDAAEADLTPLGSFILPGGSEGGAMLHFARTVCRRAERAVVALARDPDQGVDPQILVYLNRLSDLLFDWARLVNHRAGATETPWRPER